MYNFYGGPSGESFKIKWIFNTRYGNGNSMENDIKMGWSSPIAIDEFVIISYGSPGTDNYDILLNRDLEVENQSYNSTLWQKTYDETENKSNGISYKWITSMTGNTPTFTLGDANGQTPPIQNLTKILDADQSPSVWIDKKSKDNPIIYFALPRSQDISLGEFTLLDADQAAEVKLDKEDINHPKLVIKLPKAKGISVDSTVIEKDNDQPPSIDLSQSTANETRIKFELPQAKKVEVDNSVDLLNVNENPSINLTGSTKNLDKIKFQLPRSQVIKKVQINQIGNQETPTVELITVDTNGETYDINNPLLKFNLPRIQSFISENVSSVPIGANEKPSIEFDGDSSEPTLKFKLPVSQIFTVGAPNILGPQELPKVSIKYEDTDTTQNNPSIIFDLPRATKFYYGELLGQKQNYLDQINSIFSEYEIGDYYININTGAIYYVSAIDKEQAQATFNYVACLQAPLPNIDSNGIDPYDNTDNPVDPAIVSTETEQGQKWTFNLPKIPVINAKYNQVSSTQPGKVTEEKTTNSITFNFDIPKGTKLEVGNNIPTSGAGFLTGDLYLNTASGQISKWNGTQWITDGTSLKGPAGDAISIINSYNEEDGVPNIESDINTIIGANFIKQKKGDSYLYSNDEIFALTYNNITYWYYCTDPINDIWARAQLTGNISSSVKDEYTTETEKIYSSQYINSLINKNENNKDKTAYSKEYIDEITLWGSWTVNGNLKDGNGNLII